ncbi:glycosyltransferase family 4 protein [candidate division KSB1 bacterium]|nr:glycosyltransferase family 4 protein [candidate division KSB1 bacterium]
MNIAIINQPWNEFPSIKAASIAIWNYEIASRLQSAGHKIVVYSKTESKKPKFEDVNGISCRRVSTFIDQKLLRYLKRLSKLFSETRPLFASVFFYFGYIFQIAFDLRRMNCDIVHIHNLSQFVPIILLFNPRIKIVLHMHCEWLTQLDANLVKKRVRKLDRIFCCSDYITQKIRNKFPEYCPICHTIYNGVDIDRYNKSHEVKKNGTYQLLFVGRISPEKGIHVMLDAYKKISTSMTNVKFNIVGPYALTAKEYIVSLSDDPKIHELASFYNHDYMDYLHNQVQSNNLHDVSFAGLKTQDELVSIYESADILVNPSFSESFGMSLIEAMSSKVPVVCSNVGGMTEIVDDGKTGCLIEAGDADELANAILRLLPDKNRRVQMGETGRKKVIDLFSWDSIARKLAMQYQAIMEIN